MGVKGETDHVIPYLVLFNLGVSIRTYLIHCTNYWVYHWMYYNTSYHGIAIQHFNLFSNRPHTMAYYVQALVIGVQTVWYRKLFTSSIRIRFADSIKMPMKAYVIICILIFLYYIIWFNIRHTFSGGGGALGGWGQQLKACERSNRAN